MAQIPYNPVPGAPQEEPLPGVSVPTDSGAFGGYVGAATARLGQTIEGAGADLFQIAMAKASLTNEMIANDAATKFMQGVTERWSKYSRLEGQAANAALGGFKSDLEDYYKETIKSLPNLQTQTMFSRTGRYYTDSYFRTAQNYADGEWKKWQDTTAISAADAHGAQAVLFANDPIKMDVELHLSDDNIRKLWEPRQYDKDTVDDLTSKNRGKNIAAIVKSLIDSGRPDQASQIIERYKDQIDKNSLVTAYTLLKPIQLKNEADAKADSILKGQAPSAPPVPGQRAALDDLAYKQLDFYMGKGYSRQAAAAIVGHQLVEDPNLDPSTVNSIGAVGRSQWLGPRADALKAFAASQNKDWKDPSVQDEFLLHELDTEPRTVQLNVKGRLQGATNVDAATAAFADFERAEGWSPENPQGIALWDQRLVLAQALMEGKSIDGIAPKVTKGMYGLPDRGWALQQALDQTEGRPDIRNYVLQNIDQAYNAAQAQMADSLKAIELQEKERKRISDQNLGVLMQDLDSDNPKWTLQQVEANPNLTTDDKRTYRTMYLATLSGEADTAKSNATSRLLLDQIRNGKITTLQPLVDAFVKGDLNRAGFNFVKKEWQDAQTPDGQRLGEMKDRLVKRFSSQITGSSSLLGKIDPLGDQNLYNFESYMDKKIAEYRAAGKDWSTLFNPKAPDFIGDRDTLRKMGFISSLSEIYKRTADIYIGENLEAADQAVPEKPALPGEAPVAPQESPPANLMPPPQENPYDKPGIFDNLYNSLFGPSQKTEASIVGPKPVAGPKPPTIRPKGVYPSFEQWKNSLPLDLKKDMEDHAAALGEDLDTYYLEVFNLRHGGTPTETTAYPARRPGESIDGYLRRIR